MKDDRAMQELKGVGIGVGGVALGQYISFWNTI